MGQFLWHTLSGVTQAQSTKGGAQTNTGTGVVDSQTDIDQAVNLPYSFWGHNTGMRMMASLMAGVTAMIYGWALGPLALGAALAQLGLIVMLVLLPVTLLLLAFPSDPQNRGRSGAKGIGGRMLRITGGFFLAKFAILIAITTLIAMIAVLESAVSGFQGLGMLSQMFIPVAALLILRYLLKKMGMGNITSLSGALALPTAGAMAVAGEKTMSAKVQTTASKIGDKTGINRFDRFSKKVARSPVTAAKKGKEMAVEGTKKGAKLAAKLGTDVAIGAATGGTGLVAKQAMGAAVKGAGKAALDKNKTPSQRIAGLADAAAAVAGGGKIPGLDAASKGGKAMSALTRFQSSRLDADEMPMVAKYSAKAGKAAGPLTGVTAAAELGAYVIPTKFGTPRPISVSDAGTAMINTSTQGSSQVFSIAPQALSVWQDTSHSSLNTRQFDQVAASLGDAADAVANSARLGQVGALALAGAAAEHSRAARTVDLAGATLERGATRLPQH
jgi:hypothetical protein